MVGLRVGLRYLAGAALLVLMSGHFASADVFTMDSFTVTTPAGTWFSDPFNGNNITMSGTVVSPVTAPGVFLPSGAPVKYVTSGSFTEDNHQATLDTTNGVLLSSPPPFNPIQQVTARWAGGFTPTFAFGTTGVFDLSEPSTTGAAYGIEMMDLTPSHKSDTIALRIFRTALGTIIDFVNLDFFDNTLTVVDSVALDLTHDQIELDLAYDGSTITGSYAYGDSGTFGALTAFSNTTTRDTNDGATSISPAFNAFTPVPEPGTLAVFLSGMAGLACLMRRKKSTRRDTPTD